MPKKVIEEGVVDAEMCVPIFQLQDQGTHPAAGVVVTDSSQPSPFLLGNCSQYLRTILPKVKPPPLPSPPPATHI